MLKWYQEMDIKCEMVIFSSCSSHTAALLYYVLSVLLMRCPWTFYFPVTKGRELRPGSGSPRTDNHCRRCSCDIYRHPLLSPISRPLAIHWLHFLGTVNKVTDFNRPIYHSELTFEVSSTLQFMNERQSGTGDYKLSNIEACVRALWKCGRKIGFGLPLNSPL